jgi:hypothetical protein
MSPSEVRPTTLHDEEPLNIAMEQRNSDSSLLPENVEERLYGGLRVLDNARRRAGKPADCIQVFKHSTSINYAAYCFDDAQLLFIPYAHKHREEARAPRIVIDLEIAPIMSEFWFNEMKCMADSSCLSTEPIQ